MNNKSHSLKPPCLRYAMALAAVFSSMIGTVTADALDSPLLDMADALLLENQQSPNAENHRVLVLDDGFESFVLRVHLVRSAKTSIDLQTFIWADEETSRYFENELIAAAKRGVKIRLLVDHMWSTKNKDRLAWNLEHLDDIEIKLYRPMAKRLKPSLPRKIVNMLTPNNTNQRMHTKVMLVDGVVGITGGRNIGNNYFDYSTQYNFKDRDILVAGPSVNDMAASFERYWKYKHVHSTEDLLDIARSLRNGTIDPIEVDDDFDVPYFQRLNRLSEDPAYVIQKFVAPSMAAHDVQFVADKPGRKTWSYYMSPHGGGAMDTTMREYFLDADELILAQSPYIILNRRTRRMMRKAKKRAPNLEVKVSTNSFGSVDHLETYSANYRLRTKVIRGLGFEIYEYKPNPDDTQIYLTNFDELKLRAEGEGYQRPPYLSVHGKTYVFDNHTAYVGTYNLDPRSFYINSECGVFVRDPKFVADISQRLLRDMAPENSWVIARKKSPLSELNVAIEGLSSLLPVDLWPVRYTSGFELKDGDEPVSPDHPEFYDRYRDLGSFPGSNGLSLELLLLEIYKGIGKAATPIL